MTTKIVVNAATGMTTEVPLSAEDLAQREADIAASSAARAAAVPGQIKAEARRRILAAYPDWMQTNMVARGVELQDAWRRNGKWTAGETTEAVALQAAWDWIKSIRAKSNALEANPPADVTADEHWA